jgi:hypothetical protein
MQGPSRRQVCAGTALAGISWALGGCAPEGDRTLGPTNPIPETPHGRGPLGLADFREIVGSAITVEVNGAVRPLTLTAVRDHGAPVRRPVPRGESFTLVLDTDQAMPIDTAATYAARSPALGPFTLFLVPHRAPGRALPRYSATFSRI